MTSTFLSSSFFPTDQDPSPPREDVRGNGIQNERKRQSLVALPASLQSRDETNAPSQQSEQGVCYHRRRPQLRVARRTSSLTTETVEGAALALEGVDNVERRDGLALGVLGVGDGVTDDALEEGLEDTTGLLVDHWRGC